MILELHLNQRRRRRSRRRRRKEKTKKKRNAVLLNLRSTLEEAAKFSKNGCNINSQTEFKALELSMTLAGKIGCI
jgi:hypothetical protein